MSGNQYEKWTDLLNINQNRRDGLNDLIFKDNKNEIK